MHSDEEIAFHADDRDIGVLQQTEPSAEPGLSDRCAAADAKCHAREVHQAIGAMFVRAWAVRRRP